LQLTDLRLRGVEWRNGWSKVVGSMIGQAAGIYIFNVVMGFFVVSLDSQFGWGRGRIALASGALFASSLVLPLAGALSDRFSVASIALSGSVLFAGCYVALALMTGQYWEYLVILAIIGFLAGPCTNPFVLARPIVVFFDKARGLALGVSLCGAPLILALVIPVLQNMIAVHGWRAGFLLMAPISLIAGALCFALLRRASPAPSKPQLLPENTGVEAPANFEVLTVREAMTDARFWLLVVAAALMNLPIGAFVTSLQPTLSGEGIDGRTAALLGVWQAVTVVFGRVAFGALLDRFWPPLVASLVFAVPTMGFPVFAYSHRSIALLAIGIAFISTAVGAEIDVLSFLASRYFGLKVIGALSGIIGGICGISVSLGGIAAGYLFDILGSYKFAMVWGAALSAIATIALLSSGLLARRAASV
jgi:MFS family permease